MDFGDIGGIGWVIGRYVKTPEGEEAVEKYLTSPEGIALLQDFASTPEGKEAILSILPQILDDLALPPGVADTIRSALRSQK